MFHPARYPNRILWRHHPQAFSTVQVIAPCNASISCPLGADVQDWLTHPFRREYKMRPGFMVSVGFIAIEIQPVHHFAEFSDNLSF